MLAKVQKKLVFLRQNRINTFAMLKRYIRKYALSLLVTAIAWYLSLFRPPHLKIAEVAFFDKWAHLLMYGGLTATIWFDYLRSHTVISGKKIAVWGICMPILMSGAIELIQEYGTTYRSGDWLDLAANSLGVLLGTGFGWWVLRPLLAQYRKE